jgi:glucose-6-phosphate 1-dehydrogenase
VWLSLPDRAQFYDATGAALDMLVTPLFQVAAVAILRPGSRWP